MADEIKIAGAGISGLTAAILLAKEGFKVTVYEKTPYPGGRHSGDFQFLENWTTEEDVLEVLKGIGIEINFPYEAFNELSFYSPSLKEYQFKSSLPMLYGVKRGREGSIDEGLAKQAEGYGVNLEFRKSVFERDVDIVATGPKKVMGFAMGFNFETKSSDRIMILFDNHLAPGSYSYFVAIKGRATICCCAKPKTVKERTEHLEAVTKDFQKIHRFSIKNKEPFSGFNNFILPKTAVKNGKIYIGEAAGFQDAFAGFGMRYAFLSAYFAAKSIIRNLDYDKLWKDAFSERMEISLANKFLFKKIGNFGYERLINFANHQSLMKALERSDDGRLILRKQYLPSISKKIVLPFAKRSLKDYGKT